MNVLAVFCKEPQPGKVKTRLVADGMSQNEVLQLYTAFLEDILELARQSGAGQKWAYYAPPASEAFQQKLKDKGFEIEAQSGEDLGQRMARLFQTAFSKGAGRIVLIGSDSPSLPKRYIEQAFQELENKEVVIGPTRDGGYYLIGLSKWIPEIFQNIHWSTPDVLMETLSRLDALNILSKTALLPYWYDIDEKKDLSFLRFHLESLRPVSNGSFPEATWQALTDRTSKR